MRTPSVRGTGALRFSHYDQMVRAAIDGQGVALGRVPLVEEQIRAGELATPLTARRYAAPAADRAYWVMVSPLAAGRRETTMFVDWLREQAGAPPIL